MLHDDAMQNLNDTKPNFDNTKSNQGDARPSHKIADHIELGGEVVDQDGHICQERKPPHCMLQLFANKNATMLDSTLTRFRNTNMSANLLNAACHSEDAALSP